jgi:MFS transporter, OFA family, oxalate/formate antiporter
MNASKVPAKAWVVVLAGMSINLCLGILYAWSVWKVNLIGKADAPAGTAMTGINEGWTYLSKAEGTWAYALCGFTFALFMIPGGRLQDRYGPKLGAMLAGLFLGAGCILAGVMQSYLGLILGFGLLGGIGMGFGYAAATPAAVKWFGPQRRGLIVGLVVGGFGAAAIYIAPLAKYLIATQGISGSFIGLGVLFGAVILVAAQFLNLPPKDYVPPVPAVTATNPAPAAVVNWTAPEMLKTWQFVVLLFLFIASAQSGLLVIANAVPILNSTASSIPFFAANAWILASFGGLINASGRIGTGLYSDRIGRMNAYTINGAISAICLFLTPMIMQSKEVGLLFLVVGVAFWQYGGSLALLPAITADFFGPKNMGLNYGLVFLGWGIAFFIPQLAGYIEDYTGNLDAAFYLSGTLLVLGVILARFLRKPQRVES